MVWCGEGDIKAPPWRAAIAAPCWPERSQTEPGAAALPLFQRGRRAEAAGRLLGRSQEAWATLVCALWTYWLLRKPNSNAQCKHSHSYPTWNHARPLAWNPFYLTQKKRIKIKMIRVNKQGHVAKATQEIYILFLAPPNPGDDNPLFAFFLYLDCKFLKTETVFWYLFIQSLYISPKDHCND